jgi:chromosome segregation ATPase
MAGFGSAIGKIFSDLTETLNTSKNEVNDIQSDLKEEKDEIHHIEEAKRIVNALRGSTDKFTDPDIRDKLGKAEEHIDKARNEEEELTERHKEEVEISQEVDTDLRHLEKEIEKIRHEM